MEIKYNKSALYELDGQLRIREKALPTLKNKEAALRTEVKKLQHATSVYQELLDQKQEALQHLTRLWVEFESNLVKIKSVIYLEKTVAGVKIPFLDSFEFELAEISLYHKPDWFLDGIFILKDLTQLYLQRDTALQAARILEKARRKTTQKVNLYEKVQIPAYQESIRKIKRFLEDEENLNKAAQKILKRKAEQKTVK